MKIILLIFMASLPDLNAEPVAIRSFNVRLYGAVGDGKTLDTTAIQKAIDTATIAGGGTVVFPPGTYVSSSFHLKSRVTLQLDKGAILLGNPQRTGYQKVNFHALILAENQTDIGIRGQGTIDGNGKLLAADTERLAREGVLPDAKEGQRPCIINFRECRNVTVRDITLRDSAMWVQDYRDCEDLLIENVTLKVKGTDYRAALVCDDVKNLTLDRFNVLTAGKEPLVVLHDVDGATIRNSKPPPRTVRFIEEMGKTNQIKILKSL